MIRLQRVGRKHEPVFRLVLTDSKNGPKSGKFLEILGSYDARRSEKAEFDLERVKSWINKGAKLSDTVHNLLITRKIIEGKKINVLGRKTPIVSADSAKSSQPSQEATAGEAVEPKEEKEPETVEIASPDSPVEPVAPEETVVV